MSLTNWIATQTNLTKLFIGLGIGLLVYGGFRYLIHLANKSYKEVREKKGNPLSQKNIRKYQEMQLKESGY